MRPDARLLPAEDLPLELRGGQRPREVVALHQIAARVAQQPQLIFRLHALGDDGHLEVAGDVEDQLDEVEIALVKPMSIFSTSMGMDESMFSDE